MCFCSNLLQVQLLARARVCGVQNKSCCGVAWYLKTRKNRHNVNLSLTFRPYSWALGASCALCDAWQAYPRNVALVLKARGGKPRYARPVCAADMPPQGRSNAIPTAINRAHAATHASQRTPHHDGMHRLPREPSLRAGDASPMGCQPRIDCDAPH